MFINYKVMGTFRKQNFYYPLVFLKEVVEAVHEGDGVRVSWWHFMIQTTALTCLIAISIIYLQRNTVNVQLLMVFLADILVAIYT